MNLFELSYDEWKDVSMFYPNIYASCLPTKKWKEALLYFPKIQPILTKVIKKMEQKTMSEMILNQPYLRWESPLKWGPVIDNCLLIHQLETKQLMKRVKPFPFE